MPNRHGGDAGTQTGPYVGSASEARRLSRAELDNTLRDVFGDTTAPASKLLAEDLFVPYDNDYTTQLASGALIDSLEVLANDVATRVTTDPQLRSKLVPCTPTSAGDSACFKQVVDKLVTRAFRRPLAAGEADSYMTLLSFATEVTPGATHDFYTAVNLLVRSLIQDPELLYRIETGKQTSDPRVFTLNDDQIAVRMSYLLWGGPPDAALLADANAGKLQTAKTRRSAADRMLNDARAKAQLHRFHAMWLGYRKIPQSAQLAAAFQTETAALIDRVVWGQPQSYLNVFGFGETYVDNFLADHYDLPHPKTSPGWVSYGSSGRAGILSQGSVLSAFSKFSDTSPTQRGIFVRTRLLCQTIKPPPPTVAADKPPTGDQNAVCKIDRYSQHRASTACAGCHSLTDGIGFGLERYDNAGVYRTHDDGLTQCPIAGQGEIVGVGKFSGPAELGKLLVDKDLVAPCLVQQLMHYVIGRPLAGNELDEADALTREFASKGHSLRELLLAIVESDAFARRLEPQ